MNRLLRYILLTGGLTWSLTLSAQPGQMLSGQVTSYRTNQMGDYDGLQLRTATGMVQLRFPPHTAAQMLKLAPVGQVVTASVASQPHPPRPPDNQADATTTYRLVDLHNQRTNTGIHLADIRPPAPAPGKLVQAEGPLTGELRDDTGRLTALLTDQYIIDLKPHQGELVRALLTGAKRLRVVGYERTEPGFVNKTGRKLIHPTTLTINGQTFAL